MPLLSIIMPVYNAEQTIATAIDSIISQTFKDFELLIIDGASTDGTLEIVHGYVQKDNRIRLSSEKDKGIYDAMNKGIRAAKGDWLYFLGSDDILIDADILSTIFSGNAHLQYDLLYGKALFKHLLVERGQKTDYRYMVKNEFNICHQAIFYAKKLFTLIGEYNLRYPVYADFDFNLKCFKNENIRTLYIDKVIAVFNEEGTSMNGLRLDGFYSGLLKKYIDDFEDPVALYQENEKLKQELFKLTNSREFRIGRYIVEPVRKMKQIFQRAKPQA